MQAFLLRLAALAMRFLCPLAILALSNAATMGAYYLFISYFTFVVGVSALELAVPFSRKFLRCKNEKQRRVVFNGLLANQVVVSTVLAVPAGVLVSTWAGVPAVLVPLFCLSLATEACVNEVGRFFWNIGEWRMPSLRDFVRAAVFTTAILGSVYVENDVLSAITFLTITVGNLCIMGWEWRSWGKGRLEKPTHAARMVSSAWSRAKRSLAGSLPQFVHMQLLGLQPLLERTLIEKTTGLEAVGAFSFLTAVMQSAAGLLLVPIVAKTRQGLLGARTASERIYANRQSLTLLIKIGIISGVLAVMVYVMQPLLKLLLGKDIPATLFLVVIAYLSSVSAIFCSAIAPLLTVKGYAWPANGLTFLALAPLFIAQWICPEVGLDNLGLMTIGLVGLLLLLGRVMFINRASKLLIPES